MRFPVSTNNGFPAFLVAPRLPHGFHVLDGFRKGRTIDVWLQGAGIEEKTLLRVLAQALMTP